MRKILLFLLLSVAAILNAQNSSRENDKVKEFNRVYDEYELFEKQHAKDTRALWLKTESMLQQGKDLDNYQIEFFALTTQAGLCFKSGDRNGALQYLLQTQEVAKKNDDLALYYKARYNECDYARYFNPSMGMLKAQELIKEAAEMQYEPGLVYGHRLLGEMNLYNRYEYGNAAVEFLTALQIAENLPDPIVDIEKLYVLYASALVELNDFTKANKVLNDLTKGNRKITEDERMSINIIRLDMAYNQKVPANLYDSTFNVVKNDPSYEAIFPEDTRLFYDIRQLIRTGQSAKAITLIPKLELLEDQLRLRRDAYRELGNYEAALILCDSIKAVEDSLSMNLRNMDLDAIQTQMLEAEMRDKIKQAKMERKTIMLSSVIALLAIALVATIVMQKRRDKKNR